MGEDHVPLRERLMRKLDAQPKHLVADGPAKGWSAKDVDPSEYTDDDFAAQFPEVSDGPL